jgi:amidase
MIGPVVVAGIDHCVTRDNVVWAFGPDLTPVLEVDPGAVVKLETNDCFTGQIRTEADLVTDLDMSRVNSATGPVAVRGAEPGDSLVVELLDVRPAAEGFACVIPGIGQLSHLAPDPVTKRFRIDGDTIHMTDRISFPLRPMVGVVGVATGGEQVSNALAGPHGGNLDDHLHGPGTTLLFPVRQAGGMFAVGDMHASMGDGEICGTGVEIAGEVTVRFGLVKGRSGSWPVAEQDDRWIAHGTSAGDTEEALHAACEEAARLLVDEWGFTVVEAYLFLSVACDVGICQACRPSPFSRIARVVVLKVSACPRPFRI